LERAQRRLARVLFEGRNGYLILALAISLGVLLFTHPEYFTIENLRVIALNQSSVGIGAVGMAFLIIAGQIDLSIGSIFMATSMAAAFLTMRFPAPIAIAGGLALGCILGLVNGSLVWRIRVSPLIVTLGTLTIFSGGVLVLTKGVGYYVTQDAFVTIGNATPLGVPSEIWALVAIAVIGYVLMSRTTIGRYVYAIGSNRQAAEAAGINVRRIVVTLFVVNGLLVAVVGVLTASRFSSANIGYGVNFNLDVITAVILGGVAFTGGEGSIIGVMLAVAFLGVVSSGLITLGVDPYYTDVIKGSALVLSVGLDQLTGERRERYRRNLALAEYMSADSGTGPTQVAPHSEPTPPEPQDVPSKSDKLTQGGRS
jgi:ribose/xylose/arabinose/galactoside ABC-type transport system permease subunit